MNTALHEHSRELPEVQQEVLLSYRCKNHPGQCNYRLINFTRAEEKAPINPPWILGPKHVPSDPAFEGCSAGSDILSSSKERSVSVSQPRWSDVTRRVALLTPAAAWMAQRRPQAGTSPFPGVPPRWCGRKTTKHNKNPNQTRSNKESKLIASPLPPKACPCSLCRCAPRWLPRAQNGPGPSRTGTRGAATARPRCLPTHRLRPSAAGPSRREGARRLLHSTNDPPAARPSARGPRPPPFMGALRSRAGAGVGPGPGPGPHSPRPLLPPPPAGRLRRGQSRRQQRPRCPIRSQGGGQRPIPNEERGPGRGASTTRARPGRQ